MPQWGRFSLFWRKWIQFIEKLKCWSVFPLWIKKWHLLCHSNYWKKVLVNKKYWSPSRKHVLVYPRNKIDWSIECYNIKCPRTQMLQRSEKENHKNYLEKGTLGTWTVEVLSTKKQWFIKSLYIIYSEWNWWIKKKSFFFFFFKWSMARSFDKWFCWEINWNVKHDNTS